MKNTFENLPQGEYIKECIKKLIELEIAYEEKHGRSSGRLPDQKQTKEETFKF